jgi:hypothetical protein
MTFLRPNEFAFTTSFHTHLWTKHVQEVFGVRTRWTLCSVSLWLYNASGISHFESGTSTGCQQNVVLSTVVALYGSFSHQGRFVGFGRKDSLVP